MQIVQRGKEKMTTNDKKLLLKCEAGVCKKQRGNRSEISGI